MLMPRFVIGTVLVGMLVLGPGVVSGQNYPNKPIRIVTGSPGSGGDFDARQIAQGISGPLGQPVIVDNRQTLFVGEVGARGAPDDYTLTVQGGGLWLGPIFQKMNYDLMRDFSPIAAIERTVFIVAVNSAVPVKSVKELIALAKAKPGGLNYGSAAVGTANHLSVELFNSMAGVNIVHVPYKGTPLAISALIGGEIQVLISDWSQLAPHVKSGKLTALAVTSANPSALTPGLPTVAAAGLPGYEAGGLTGMWAPAKTPDAIINRLSQEVLRFLNLPKVRERFLSAGIEVVASTPEQFAAFLKSDIAKTTKLVRDMGLKTD